MTDLHGKTVVITGASSGIGAAAARLLHVQGANVVLGARRGHRLKELAMELDVTMDRVQWAETDIRSPEDVERLFDTAKKRFGAIDVLVANAGVGAYGGIADLTNEEIRELVDTNLTGTIWCVREAIRHLKQSGGDIVIVSSVAGLRGRATEAVYAATKHGLVGLAGAIDRELRPSGIRVTTMCPGAAATEFALGRGRSSEMLETTGMLLPSDVAEAIVSVLRQPRTMRTLLWSIRSMASEN
jgi:NAD(P)-dependent dehydrogenase (short-subunit alcohol dehydrogenase family)